MARLTATLLFAALASAEYTTTVWMTKIGNSDKYGYVASVVDADAEHITMVLDFDANTNTTALNLGGVGGNFTFGPSSFTINQSMTRAIPTPTGDVNVQIQCTQPAQSGEDVQCTQVRGEGWARYVLCNDQVTRSRNLRPNTTTTYLHSYGTGIWGSSGVETITWALNIPPQPTTTPAWCTSDEAPESALTAPFTGLAQSYAVYQVVVTAGEEKLSAYSGSSVAVSTITPSSGSTGSVAEPTASAADSASAGASPTTGAPAESTGAAGQLGAAVPVLAGLGVAAVMGMM